MEQYSDEWYIKLHERVIMKLSLENKALQRKIDRNNAEIEKLRGFNREIKGRPVKA